MADAKSPVRFDDADFANFAEGQDPTAAGATPAQDFTPDDATPNPDQTNPAQQLTSTIDTSQAQYQKRLQQLQDLLTQRQGPVDVPWGALMAGFGAPTKTGSFFESLGNVGQNVAAYDEKRREEKIPLAQAQLELINTARQNELALGAQKAFINMFGGGAGSGQGQSGGQQGSSSNSVPVSLGNATPEQALAFGMYGPAGKGYADLINKAIDQKISGSEITRDYTYNKITGQVTPIGLEPHEYTIPDWAQIEPGSAGKLTLPTQVYANYSKFQSIDPSLGRFALQNWKNGNGMSLVGYPGLQPGQQHADGLEGAINSGALPAPQPQPLAATGAAPSPASVGSVAQAGATQSATEVAKDQAENYNKAILARDGANAALNHVYAMQQILQDTNLKPYIDYFKKPDVISALKMAIGGVGKDGVEVGNIGEALRHLQAPQPVIDAISNLARESGQMEMDYLAKIPGSTRSDYRQRFAVSLVPSAENPYGSLLAGLGAVKAKYNHDVNFANQMQASGMNYNDFTKSPAYNAIEQKLRTDTRAAYGGGVSGSTLADRYRRMVTPTPGQMTP